MAGRERKPEKTERVPDILRHEFVGLPVEVAWSSNPDAVGLAGHVVDETRNMLMIKTRGTEDSEGGVKALPKKDCHFIFTLPDGEMIRVEGELLVSRPEDRIKRKQKVW
jgi:ribonuclease P protein subunit POP4